MASETQTTTKNSTPDTNPSHPNNPSIVVKGLQVRPQTQCSHWHSHLDIVAIRHYCCDEFYACIDCHDALAGHASGVWPRRVLPGNDRGDERRNGTAKTNADGGDEVPKVVLCGQCRHLLTVAEYLSCENTCPNGNCRAAFNPGCAKHYDRYFEM